MRRLLLAVVLSIVAGCKPPPPVSIVHLDTKQPEPEASGEPVRLRRPPPEPYAGLRSGAYVIRGSDDWKQMWRGSDAPAYPDGVHPMADMILVLGTEDAIVSGLHVREVVQSSSDVTVFVRQTMMGEGCIKRPEEPAARDAVIVPRSERPVKFVIEDEDAPSCGEPPKAQIACKLVAAVPAPAGAPAAPPSPPGRVTAKVGDAVECEQTSIAQGKYPLVDQMLSIQDLPPGSNAKLTFKKGAGSSRATMTLDSFGTYAIRAEATDEAGRKGHATAIIDVLPKKTRDVIVQLTWQDVDLGDYANSAPRVLLRVAQEGPKGQRCSSEVPVPGLCDAKSRGPYTQMRIPASRRRLPISLLYYDERAQEGPSPCINVWFNGDKTTTICDANHRHAEDRWELGTLDVGTGKIVPPKPPVEKKPAEKKSVSAKAKN